MAGTAKLIKEINGTREEISHIVDLLSKRLHKKMDMAAIVKNDPVNSIIFIVLMGIFAGLIAGRLKGLLKVLLLVYVTKQNISRLIKIR